MSNFKKIEYIVIASIIAGLCTIQTTADGYVYTQTISNHGTIQGATPLPTITPPSESLPSLSLLEILWKFISSAGSIAGIISCIITVLNRRDRKRGSESLCSDNQKIAHTHRVSLKNNVPMSMTYVIE